MTLHRPPPRLPAWEARLGALIEGRLHEPFRWGVHDCALWGADAVFAETGIDFAAPFRGKYDDQIGAALALRKYGTGTITRTFDAALRRCPIALLRRGDIAMIGSGRDGSVGVVIGGEGLFVDDLALMRVERKLFTRGWRVG